MFTTDRNFLLFTNFRNAVFAFQKEKIRKKNVAPNFDFSFVLIEFSNTTMLICRNGHTYHSVGMKLMGLLTQN